MLALQAVNVMIYRAARRKMRLSITSLAPLDIKVMEII